MVVQNNKRGGIHMNDILIKDETKIENMIYEIRGKQVMLDSDLARLYQCKNGTKSINLAVKRHINRFPERFIFQLTEQEYKSLRFQFETANNKTRTLPYAFTEQGVAMLSSVLRTEVAEKVSVAIMDAFVSMRKYISTNLIEQKYINNLVLEHDNEIKLLKQTFDNFKDKTNHIFYEGQIYDAYSLLIHILENAKTSIIIIDNYIDKNLLDILSKTSKNILIITNKYNNQDYEKYKQQYNNIKIKISNSFHDKYIIIDNNILYHCGASFKDLGKKCFGINKIKDKKNLKDLLDIVNLLN